MAIYRIIMRILDVVARLGFEPRQTESEFEYDETRQDFEYYDHRDHCWYFGGKLQIDIYIPICQREEEQRKSQLRMNR